MLNLIQHLTKSRTYETLKQVQGDRSGLFTRPSKLFCLEFGTLGFVWVLVLVMWCLSWMVIWS
jgi:hypothetical protein